MKSEIIFTKDTTAATMYVRKIYATDAPTVWNYFTNPVLLDLWWAPQPWKCQTLKMDFREGGIWNYAMIGPENEKHFAGTKYHEITPNRSFDMTDFFTDEKDEILKDLPSQKWLLGFTGVEEGTKLTCNIHFKNIAEMEQILEMGFEEGFKKALNQLEEILTPSI